MTPPGDAPLVLVVYATRYGSTASVARAVGDRLGQHGLRVDLSPAHEIDSVRPYDAVVIGGALYMGRWHRDARRFVHRHRAALTRIPVAVFGMGPISGTEPDVDGSREQLERALTHVPELVPIDVAIFGGVIDPARLHSPLSRMQAYDGRDWDEIERWSDELAVRFGAADREAVR
jgi:menaquinone-dependent protoporphyrinogen oxidase